jgi:2-polyprenyl-3-methyl-5-hydroxy-6-metoxy-1,4-benzoquinol methylase
MIAACEATSRRAMTTFASKTDDVFPRYYYADGRTEMNAFLPPIFTRVLEVGCGAGVFSGQLPKNVETWGVEPLQGPAAEAGKRLTRVLCGRYEDVEGSLQNGYFDVVVCNDVIEHMQDHDAFLESARQKLRVGGHLVGSVPNVRYYKVLYDLVVRREWIYDRDGVLDRTHLRFFTDRSFARTLRAHRFDVELMRGIYSATEHGRTLVKHVLFGAATTVSFGTLADIRFRQFAFRACKREP